MGFAFQATYGLPFVAIRIFNTYGPRQPRYVIFDFIQKLRRNPKRLEVLGDGNQIRDYCHISDMVEAFMMVAEKGDGVYNAAGGKPTSIRELAELIVSMLAPDAEIVYGGKTWKGDIQALLADISRTRALGFNPKVDLKKGDWFADMLRYI
jgi:UDP-glucose 4-epimerase